MASGKTNKHPDGLRTRKGITPGGREYSASRGNRLGTSVKQTSVKDGNKIYFKSTFGTGKGKAQEKSIFHKRYSSEVERPVGRGPKKPKK